MKVQRCYFYYKLFRRYGECNGFTPNPGVQRRWLRQRDRMVGEGRVSVCAEGDYTIGSSAPIEVDGRCLRCLPATDSEKIKLALKTAFAVDAFTAYELFVARRLQPGETVDVYLAELRRLAVPFAGLPEKALVCAFVAGLPDGAKQLLRAGSRMDDLPLTHILARARAILKDESGVAAVATPAGAASGTVCETRRAVSATEFRCYASIEPNHIARNCLLRQRGRGRVYDGRGGGGRGGGRGELRCYRCNGIGHFASSCPGNDRGVTSSAPVCTPDNQRARRYP